MAIDEAKTDHLVQLAANGEGSALGRLLGAYRGRIRAAVEASTPPILKRRVDPSDIVQETLIVAERRLPAYAREKPISLYPWLVAIARDRLAEAVRHHTAKKRDVRRETSPGIAISDASTSSLAQSLIDSGTSPSGRVGRGEQQVRVRAALDRLDEDDRELLVLHYVERLRFEVIAARLGKKPGAVRMQHLRALERVRDLMQRGPRAES